MCQPLRHRAPVIETEAIETGHAASALGGAALVIETEKIDPVAALADAGPWPDSGLVFFEKCTSCPLLEFSQEQEFLGRRVGARDTWVEQSGPGKSEPVFCSWITGPLGRASAGHFGTSLLSGASRN